MKKKCHACGVQFALSGSGKRQKYCSKCARRGMVRGRGLRASKLLKTKAGKTASKADLGSFVLAQIRAQESQPVSFPTSEGNPVRICLSGRVDRKGEEVYWRVNPKEPRRNGGEGPRVSPPPPATLHSTASHARAPHTPP